jgi:hypothetical protein
LLSIPHNFWKLSIYGGGVNGVYKGGDFYPGEIHEKGLLGGWSKRVSPIHGYMWCTILIKGVFRGFSQNHSLARGFRPKPPPLAVKYFLVDFPLERRGVCTALAGTFGKTPKKGQKGCFGGVGGVPLNRGGVINHPQVGTPSGGLFLGCPRSLERWENGCFWG